jgi:hypothetical protein
MEHHYRLPQIRFIKTVAWHATTKASVRHLFKVRLSSRDRSSLPTCTFHSLCFPLHFANCAEGPVARFGDTAANAGILALMKSNGYLNRLPSPIQTIFASCFAAAFRMLLMPIDTLKTTLQAQGSRGTALLRQRIRTDGVGSLWWGAFATAAATFVGHYPWFAVYNFLSETITEPSRQQIGWWLLRAAFIGFCASVVSDTISNSLRVVKTYRQVNDTRISYTEAARQVIRQDGRLGLFGRGLKTRIIANGLQGIIFSILWKLFLKIWEDKTGTDAKER